MHLRPNGLGVRSLDLFAHMLDKLREVHEKGNIDLVIFSGDLIDKSGSGFGDGVSLYDCFKMFEDKVIRPLVELFGIGYHQFLFVPGNHEIKRDAITKDLRTELKNESEVEKSLSSGNEKLPQMEAFSKFQNEYYDTHRVEGVIIDRSVLQTTICLPIAGHKVGITLLNSAWMCKDDSDLGNIYLGRCQINKSWYILEKERCDVKIAVSHHHFSFMKETERGVLKRLLHQHYDIYVTGHTHGMDADYVQDNAGSIFQSVSAGNLYDNLHQENSEFQNGFTLLDYNIESKYVDITPFFQQEDESFDVDLKYGSQGTLRLAEPTKRLFVSLDIWLSSYTSHYAIIQNQILEEKRQQLKDSNNRLILLTALSGLGKTRLIRDAFNDGTTHIHSYYTELSNEKSILLFYDFTEILKSIGLNEGLIIVDNCSYTIFYDLIKKCPPNVRLICVNNEYYDIKDVPSAKIIRLDPQMLKSEVEQEIERALPINDQNHHICNEIKKIADGFPFMAYQLIEAYNNNGSVDITTATPLMERLIRYSEGREKEQRASMMTMSIFQPFPLTLVNKRAFDFIVNDDIMMPLDALYPHRKRAINETIARFSPALIENTHSWINVRPFPLAVYLAKEWFVGLDENDLEVLLSNFDRLKQEDSGTHRMLSNGMAHRIEYMRDMPLASEFVDRLTETPTGPFAHEKVVCSDMGSRLFLAMSSVNPAAISNCIYNLFISKTSLWLQENVNGDARRNLVWALEKLCFNGGSFAKSSMVMAKFMMAENEEWGNNATAQFKQLFHVLLPGTEANLNERFKVIDQLYHFGGEHVSIALQAIDSAFISRGFIRSGGAERFGSEDKKDYTPSNKEIWDYWYSCRDILVECTKEHNEFISEIARIIDKHASHWLRDGYFYTLFQPLVEAIRSHVTDFSTLYETITRFTIDGLVKRYSSEKQAEIRGYLQKLKPQSFVASMKEAQMGIYNKDARGDADYFTYSLQVIKPLTSQFIESGIYKDLQELKLLADENNNIAYAFFLNLAEMISDNQLSELFAQCYEIIKEKGDGKFNPFVSSICFVTRNRIPSVRFRDRLLAEGFHATYILYSAKCEDDNLTQLTNLVTYDKAGLFKVDMLDLYLGVTVIQKSESLYFMLNYLYNEYPKKVVELVNFILKFGFINDKIELDILNNLIKSLLLEYPIDNSNSRVNFEYTHFVISLLQKKNDPEFATKLNTKLIEEFNQDYLHGNFEHLYSALILNYTDVIWPSFEKAFVSDEYATFWYQIHDELGSGTGFGAGALFQVGNERIKHMCLKYPGQAPEKIARLIPIYDGSVDGSDSFGELMIWLLENFGNQKMVLDGIHANIHSFSWTGSAIGLFIHHRKSMEKLLSHKKPEVREWSSQCIREFDAEIQSERDREDFMRMHYNQ